MFWPVTDTPDHPVSPTENWLPAYIIVFFVPTIFLSIALTCCLVTYLRGRPSASASTRLSKDDVEQATTARHLQYYQQVWFPWRDAVSATEAMLPQPDKDVPVVPTVPERAALPWQRTKARFMQMRREFSWERTSSAGIGGGSKQAANSPVVSGVVPVVSHGYDEEQGRNAMSEEAVAKVAMVMGGRKMDVMSQADVAAARRERIRTLVRPQSDAAGGFSRTMTTGGRGMRPLC